MRAEVTGKPAAAFFATALAALGADAAETVMVGDDIEADVLAAQRHGLTGVLVRTGGSTCRRRTGARPPRPTGSWARRRPARPPHPRRADLPGYTLAWSDEFDGPAGSAPDPGRWQPETGGHGWGNAELQLLHRAEPRTPGSTRQATSSSRRGGWFLSCRRQYGELGILIGPADQQRSRYAPVRGGPAVP